MIQHLLLSVLSGAGFAVGAIAAIAAIDRINDWRCERRARKASEMLNRGRQGT